MSASISLQKIDWRLRLTTPDWQGFSADPEDWMDALSPTRDRSEYYVYVYLDPRNQGSYDCLGWKFKNKPFYVGKGVRGRINDPKNQYAERVIRKIEAAGMEVKRLKVATGLTEAEAHFLECNLINLIGRKNLTNLTHGGEGVSGYKWTKEQRAEKSKLVRDFYTSLTPEQKAAHYEARFANLNREKIAEKQSKTWQAMDEKRKKNIFKKRRTAIQSWWNSPAGIKERARRSALQAERNRQRARTCR